MKTSRAVVYRLCVTLYVTLVMTFDVTYTSNLLTIGHSQHRHATNILTILRINEPSDYRTVVLSNLRTIKPSDYQTSELSRRRTIETSPCELYLT